MDSTSKCFLCGASAPNLSCPEPKCPVRACSQQHLSLHLQQLAARAPDLQPSPPQTQSASQTPASASSPACLPYTITFKPGVGRCLVSWRKDIFLGRKLARTFIHYLKMSQTNIKHEKNIDSYPGCFADYFARRTCPFWEPSCCWAQSSENASDKPLKYNEPSIVVEDNRPMGFTHYPQFLYWPQHAEHEKQYHQKIKVNDWIHVSPKNTLFEHSPSCQW